MYVEYLSILILLKYLSDCYSEDRNEYLGKFEPTLHMGQCTKLLLDSCKKILRNILTTIHLCWKAFSWLQLRYFSSSFSAQKLWSNLLNMHISYGVGAYLRYILELSKKSSHNNNEKIVLKEFEFSSLFNEFWFKYTTFCTFRTNLFHFRINP